MLHLLRVYGKSLESSQWPPVHRPLLAAEYSRRKKNVWYQGAALLIQRRGIKNSQVKISESLEYSGWRRIRTFEGIASRFTVCPLWPLGNPSKREHIAHILLFYHIFMSLAIVFFINLKTFTSDISPALSSIPVFPVRSAPTESVVSSRYSHVPLKYPVQ